MKNRSKLKGFTLVEMLTVIAIVAILSGILSVCISGYVKKAKCASAIANAKSIITTARSALVDECVRGTLNLNKNATINGRSVLVGGLSNIAMNDSEDASADRNQADVKIASAIMDTISAKGLDIGTAKRGRDIFGKTCSDYIASINGDVGIIVIYSSDGDIPFMQIYSKGVLVTYANGNYIANADNTAKFISIGESWKWPFFEAGVTTEDLDESLKNSSVSSW